MCHFLQILNILVEKIYESAACFVRSSAVLKRVAYRHAIVVNKLKVTSEWCAHSQRLMQGDS